MIEGEKPCTESEGLLRRLAAAPNRRIGSESTTSSTSSWSDPHRPLRGQSTARIGTGHPFCLPPRTLALPPSPKTPTSQVRVLSLSFEVYVFLFFVLCYHRIWSVLGGKMWKLLCMPLLESTKNYHFCEFCVLFGIACVKLELYWVC